MKTVRLDMTFLNLCDKKSDYTPFIVYSSSRLPEHVSEVLERGGRGATNDPAELFELVLKEVL